MEGLDNVAFSPNGTLFVANENKVYVYKFQDHNLVLDSYKVQIEKVKNLAASNDHLVCLFHLGKTWFIQVSETETLRTDINYNISLTNKVIRLQACEKHFLVLTTKGFHVFSYELKEVMSLILDEPDCRVVTLHARNGEPLVTYRDIKHPTRLMLKRKRNNEIINEYVEYNYPYSAVEASSVKNSLAIGSEYGSKISIYRDEKYLVTLHKSTVSSNICDMVFAENGNLLVVASSSSTIHIFDIGELYAENKTYMGSLCEITVGKKSYATCTLPFSNTATKCYLHMIDSKRFHVVVAARDKYMIYVLNDPVTQVCDLRVEAKYPISEPADDDLITVVVERGLNLSDLEFDKLA